MCLRSSFCFYPVGMLGSPVSATWILLLPLHSFQKTTGKTRTAWDCWFFWKEDAQHSIIWHQQVLIFPFVLSPCVKWIHYIIAYEAFRAPLLWPLESLALEKCWTKYAIADIQSPCAFWKTVRSRLPRPVLTLAKRAFDLCCCHFTTSRPVVHVTDVSDRSILQVRLDWKWWTFVASFPCGQVSLGDWWHCSSVAWHAYC